MNPQDCPQRDWGLYYNNTYMLHRKRGVVQIRVSDRVLWHRKDDEQWVAGNSRDLECLWPQSRAINWEGQAYYIGRQARREARRSVTLHHFCILWPAHTPMLSTYMDELCFPTEYPSMSYTLKAFKQGERNSVAVSRSIILQAHSEGALVIFRGEEAGSILFTNEQHIFTPRLDCALSKRALFRLQREGILCQ